MERALQPRLVSPARSLFFCILPLAENRWAGETQGSLKAVVTHDAIEFSARSLQLRRMSLFDIGAFVGVHASMVRGSKNAGSERGAHDVVFQEAFSQPLWQQFKTAVKSSLQIER